MQAAEIMLTLQAQAATFNGFKTVSATVSKVERNSISCKSKTVKTCNAMPKLQRTLHCVTPVVELSSYVMQ